MIKNESVQNVSRFSTKAELIARYRWPFQVEAIDALLALSTVGPESTVVDVGSGTGAVARELLEAGLNVTAIEPNDAMRVVAERELAAYANFTSVAALSDDIGLPGHSVDLVTVGRALHWLPAASTRREFVRILKPGGWLAVLAVECCDAELREAVRSIKLEANGWDTVHSKDRQPPVRYEFYFGGDHYQTISFPATKAEDWPQFFGRLCSLSNAPDAHSPHFERTEQAAKDVFDRLAVGGQLRVSVSTTLIVGKVC